jgi:hypothetical protein
LDGKPKNEITLRKNVNVDKVISVNMQCLVIFSFRKGRYPQPQTIINLLIKGKATRSKQLIRRVEMK